MASVSESGGRGFILFTRSGLGFLGDVSAHELDDSSKGFKAACCTCECGNEAKVNIVVRWDEFGVGLRKPDVEDFVGEGGEIGEVDGVSKDSHCKWVASHGGVDCLSKQLVASQ